MTNYRDNCFDYKAVIGLSMMPSNLFEVIALQVETAKYTDENEFRVWISQWKGVYKIISDTIRGIRKDRTTTARERDISLNILAKLANNLINARQKVLDQRRATRFLQ